MSASRCTTSGRARTSILAELLELAPFGSVLFSSDACAMPELYALNTALFRRALSAFFDDGVARDYWSSPMPNGSPG